MKYRLFNFLVCPTDGTFPLNAKIFHEKTKNYHVDPVEGPICNRYCGYDMTQISNFSRIIKCRECLKKEIVEAVLICPNCGRWYPVIDEILLILPDDLRYIEQDSYLSEKYHQLTAIKADEKNVDFLMRNVQRFWNERPCQGKWGTLKEQIEGTERYRYSSQPWIKKYADFDKYKNRTVLEIGCGQGIDLSQFCANGSYIIGLDLTLEGIRLAKLRLESLDLQGGADLLVASAEKLPFHKESFDYVYSWGVIHHSRKTEQIVENIYNVLKKNAACTIMYYYTYSFTKIIEASAKLINKILIFFTRDKDSFVKILRKIPVKHDYQDDILAFQKSGFSATLHAPIIKSFSKRQTRKMFKKFSNIKFELSSLHRIIKLGLKPFPMLQTFQNWLERNFGWDFIIKSSKR